MAKTSQVAVTVLIWLGLFPHPAVPQRCSLAVTKLTGDYRSLCGVSVEASGKGVGGKPNSWLNCNTLRRNIDVDACILTKQGASVVCVWMSE